MDLRTVTLLAHLIALAALLGTLCLLPFLVYFVCVAEWHLHRINEMRAGRPDPGPHLPPIRHVEAEMAQLRASERRWRGEAS